MGFKERLEEERKELHDKIEKLEGFLERSDSIDIVGVAQEALLNVQLDIMNSYLTVLINRIKLL